VFSPLRSHRPNHSHAVWLSQLFAECVDHQIEIDGNTFHDAGSDLRRQATLRSGSMTHPLRRAAGLLRTKEFPHWGARPCSYGIGQREHLGEDICEGCWASLRECFVLPDSIPAGESGGCKQQRRGQVPANEARGLLLADVDVKSTTGSCYRDPDSIYSGFIPRSLLRRSVNRESGENPELPRSGDRNESSE